MRLAEARLRRQGPAVQPSRAPGGVIGHGRRPPRPGRRARQLAVAVPFVAPSNRVDWYTGAVSAAVGIVPFIVSPLTVTRDAPKVSAAVAATAFDDDARVCATLFDAERKLAAAADNQRWQQGWWIHAGNLAFNAGVLLFLGLGYHHWVSGIINGASGAVVGEAIILTQPTGSISDLRDYLRGDLARAKQAKGRRKNLTMFYIGWGGLGIIFE